MKSLLAIPVPFHLLLTAFLASLCALHAFADEEPELTAEEKTITPAERIAELDELVRVINQQTLALDAELRDLQLQSTDLNLRLKNANGQLDELTQTRSDHVREIEKLLQESGDRISFRRQIAPIFHSHCVACHNARNGKGEYTMDNFAAIGRSGQSGDASLVPGHAEDSTLFQLIRDGSMPLDGEPLATEQIELIRKWIEQGARLDADVSPQTELFRMMPRPVHPEPPECYPAIIPVSAVAVSPDGSFLASSGYHEVLLWSLQDGQLVRRIPGVAQRVQALAFHPDGKRLAVASGTPGRLGEVKLFDLPTGSLAADLLVSQDVVPAIAISPNGRRLAIGETDGTVSVYSLDEKPKQLWQTHDHSDWVNAISWSSDGKQLLSASRDKTCKILDARTGSLKLTFAEHGQNVVAALFVGDRAASAAADGTLKIWQVADGKRLHDLNKLCGEVSTLVPLNRDRILVLGAENNTVEVNLQDGKIIQKIPLPTEWNLTAAIHSGNFLILGSHDGNLTVRHLQDPSYAPRTWAAIPSSCD